MDTFLGVPPETNPVSGSHVRPWIVDFTVAPQSIENPLGGGGWEREKVRRLKKKMRERKDMVDGLA